MVNDGATRFWWVRHAPVPEGRIIGQLDLPCDTSNKERFTALSYRLPRHAILVESGLMRCAQTIGALETAGLPLPPSQIDSDLIEQHFGRWQGHGWEDLAKTEDPDLRAFWSKPAIAAPPGGESFVDVVGRVRTAIDRLIEHHQGRDIIAVVHAGTIRAALTVALNLPPSSALSIVIDPLSLTRLDYLDGYWRIVGVNWLAWG